MVEMFIQYTVIVYRLCQVEASYIQNCSKSITVKVADLLAQNVSPRTVFWVCKSDTYEVV